MEEAHPKERSLLLRAAVLIFFTSSFWDLGQGPVLVTVQYVIDPAKASEFLHQIYKYQRVRRRDGATSWGVFVDTKAPDTYLESFKVDSWAEHERQHDASQ
ncbi:MAG: MFS transporter [Acidobacteriaceae bacterium]